MNNCLIVCNGELSKNLIQKFTKLNKPRKQLTIIAADGASNFLYKHKITPDYIIGDLDSITPAALKYFITRKVSVRKIHDQYKNDLEKCIRFAIKRKYKLISIVGFSGKRIDHTLLNLSVLKKYSTKADIKCYDEIYEYFIIKKKIEFVYRIGEVVSLIALPKAGGIKTRGLKYPLNYGTLEFGVKEGALNIANKKYVSVSLRKGSLLLYKKHFGKLELIS
jgi:thiamine pyrophosphokinase